MLLSTADCGHYAVRPVAPVSSSANTTPHTTHIIQMLYAENIMFLCGLDPDADDSAQKNKSEPGKTQSTPTGGENDGSG